MAKTQYVVANKLHQEAAAAGRRNVPIALVLFGLALAAYFVFNRNVVVPLGLVGVAVFLLARSTPDQVLTAGAQGEDHAVSILTQLPESYTLFNQVNIPNPRSSTGVNEADLIVCGPSAVFVIEVKNNNGTIVCDEQSPQWKVSKVGRRGGEYDKEMRNPIAQTKNLVWLLSEHLKKTNSKPWVQGVVVFTNPAAVLQIEGTPSVPVLRAADLQHFVESFQGNSRPDVLARAVTELAKLRTGAASAP
jgi:Nuclease-related domain